MLHALYIFTGLRDIAAEWTTDLVVVNNSCERRIEVSFELAPSKYKFVEYQVWLIDQYDRDVPDSPQLYRLVSLKSFRLCAPLKYIYRKWNTELSTQ